MRKMNKGVHAKWINALSAIKRELETQEVKSVNHLFSKFNIIIKRIYCDLHPLFMTPLHLMFPSH